MGCFLACFGTNKDQKRRKHRHYRVQPPAQRSASSKPVQFAVSSSEGESKNPISLVSEARVKPEEPHNCSTRKKVTFDSNVKAYEPVSTQEPSDVSPENEEVEKNKKEEILAKVSCSKSSSEDSSITSSLGSYPPNHRYQNCRDSDDEDEELEFEDSDLDDEDEDDGEIEYEDDLVEPKREAFSEEVNSPMRVCDLPEREVPIGLNRNARDRSAYVHSVLNPVENLTQWKAVKAKGKQTTKPQKENLKLDQEPRISFSSEPKIEQPTKPKQEIAVDASLSNWLVSPETTPVKKTSSFAFNTLSPSQGSNSARSNEDRPILGALTVEEIRQFSASSSPRKSPSRSPDEVPIIGTVGTHWSDKDSGSASSFKGIPNSTSKYREDRKVNWHSTPFETRLERALNTGTAADAYSTHTQIAS
ncbi:hypothetical protein UlMin_031724 [Ulmus minor]